MMPRDFVATVAKLSRGASAAAAPPASAVELQQALWKWKGHCLEGAAAVAGRDLDDVERALEARDALRPRIAQLVTALHWRAPLSATDLAQIRQLYQEASDADARLIDLLASERLQLQRDIDALGRTSAPPAAYGEPDAENRHRLDIVR